MRRSSNDFRSKAASRLQCAHWRGAKGSAGIFVRGAAEVIRLEATLLSLAVISSPLALVLLLPWSTLHLDVD
jgi:hypothetical protein